MLFIWHIYCQICFMFWSRFFIFQKCAHCCLFHILFLHFHFDISSMETLGVCLLFLNLDGLVTIVIWCHVTFGVRYLEEIQHLVAYDTCSLHPVTKLWGNLSSYSGFPGGASGRKETRLPIQEMWVWSLGGEDPLEEGMASHSSFLAWRIPWTEESGGLQSIGLQTTEAT